MQFRMKWELEDFPSYQKRMRHSVSYDRMYITIKTVLTEWRSMILALVMAT